MAVIRNTMAGLALGFLAWTPAAQSAGFDGSQALICAAIATAHCEADNTCMEGSAASINVPQFFRINFQDKVVRATRADGSERTTSFTEPVLDSGELVLQGVENGLGWSLMINQSDGQMTLTAAGDREAFVVFGACTHD
ncbi:MAG: hypothetical protein AAF495_17225 [Pseudomonadota bacterium]